VMQSLPLLVVLQPLFTPYVGASQE